LERRTRLREQVKIFWIKKARSRGRCSEVQKIREEKRSAEVANVEKVKKDFQRIIQGP
jgi:hypothetical protein